jgi:DNA (cytosine-5)-methyltransferase 1
MRGLERGLERTIGEIRTIAYVEIEGFIIENLVRQMEQGVLAPAPIWSDVKTFLPIAQQLRGKVDFITGGYPCQPFSNAGKRLGTEDPRHLYPYISGIVEAIRPFCCFFENVSGHLSLGFDTVYQDLERMGYAVEVGIYTAEEVGAPHERERLFILAIRKDFLDYARSIGFKSEYAISTRGYGAELTSEALANADSFRFSKQGILHQQSERAETISGSKNVAHSQGQRERSRGREQAINNRCRKQLEGSEQRGNTINNGKDQLANTGGNGSGKGHLKRQSEQSYKNGTEWQIDKFPAGQGETQYDWEEPRIKSSLGFTINGHNYREDLLRMAGNGVVEQTAEVAYIDLRRKHFENIK